MTDQPEALILAEKLEEAAGDYSQFDRYLGHESAAMLREQHAEIERLREALNEMLDESMGGIAICPLTKIKARNALGRKP